MKTIRNTVTFRANETTGAVAAVWTSEVYKVGENVRVSLWRNGHAYAEDIAAHEVRACLRNCARASKALARTEERLLGGYMELILAA